MPGKWNMKPTNVSVLQRKLLHRLLHRDLRKCSSSALASAQRLGWIFGLAGGFELTAIGREVAERSEQADPRGELRVRITEGGMEIVHA